MRREIICLFAGFGLLASPAHAQTSDTTADGLNDAAPLEVRREMSTDRPDKTESPYTVDAGRLQIELDFFNYARDRDASERGNLRSETIAVAPFNLKIGAARNADLQLLVEPYVRQTVTDRVTGARDRVEGFGDVTVRLKRNLWGNDGGGSALALMPFVKLPTSSNGIGNGAVEFGLIVPLAIGLSERVGLGLMTEVDILEKAVGGGYAPSFVNSATLAFGLTDRLGLYTELFTERNGERGSRWVVTGDMGLTYAISDDVQLDGGVNLGLTDAADDLNLFVGLSRRF